MADLTTGNVRQDLDCTAGNHLVACQGFPSEDEIEKIHFGCMQSAPSLLWPVSTTRGKRSIKYAETLMYPSLRRSVEAPDIVFSTKIGIRPVEAAM